MRRLAEAVTAYHSALEVRTRQDFPQDWANIQTNLGSALIEQGRRSKVDEATRLLAEAVTAYHSRP